MDKTEAYFIPHCDNDDCDFGAFKYTCPHCNKTVVDYEIWGKQNDICSGKQEVFECEECGKSLIMKYNKEDCEYWLRIDDNSTLNTNKDVSEDKNKTKPSEPWPTK